MTTSLKLIVSLPFGCIEKTFEYSAFGRELAYRYIKSMNRQGQSVLSYKFIKHEVKYEYSR